MKILKKNIKLFIGLIIGAIIAGSIVFAATSAKQIIYTKEGTEISNVEAALNDLYNKVPTQENVPITEAKSGIDVSNYKSIDTSSLYETRILGVRYLGAYCGSSNVSNQSTATLTINSLTIGNNYSLIAGRSNTGGSNAYFMDTGSGNVTISNATYTKSGWIINFTPTSTSITINFPLNNQTTSNGGRIYCWLFEGSI